MKKTELAKLREKTVVDLENSLQELRAKAIGLTGAIKGGKEKNVHALKAIRRNIAQTATILTLKREVKE